MSQQAISTALGQVRHATDPEEALEGLAALHRATAADSVERAYLGALTSQSFYRAAFDMQVAEMQRGCIELAREKATAESPDVLARFELTIREAFARRTREILAGVTEDQPA